jgi:hypothetical protein
VARRPLIALAAPLAALLGGLLVPLAVSAPAEAAARVTIANADGDAVADPTYATEVTVSGRGFQSIKGGYGGLYVVFGTVKGTWRPSQGGQTGRDYFYVPDSESKNNAGFQKFVAFPGSDTEDAANGGEIKANGTWSTTLEIPGSTFQALDRNGKSTTIDCLKVNCGVITIGAHGVANSSNESFTPVTFRSLGDAAASSTPSASASATASTGAATGSTSGGTPAGGVAPATGAAAPTASTPAASGPATITVDRATAVAGRALTFTATGFRPGEQVVASLDDGIAAVGPLSAGASGEVAGVLQLPLATTSGTHVLKVTGAASGSVPTESFAVTAPAGTHAVAASDDRSDRAPYLFLAVGVLALIAAVLTAILRGRLRRRQRRSAEPTTSEAPHAI